VGRTRRTSRCSRPGPQVRFLRCVASSAAAAAEQAPPAWSKLMETDTRTVGRLYLSLPVR
jgi:hypothetical protein